MNKTDRSFHSTKHTLPQITQTHHHSITASHKTEQERARAKEEEKREEEREERAKREQNVGDRVGAAGEVHGGSQGREWRGHEQEVSLISCESGAGAIIQGRERGRAAPSVPPPSSVFF
jgi:hypothetical protein